MRGGFRRDDALVVGKRRRIQVAHAQVRAELGPGGVGKAAAGDAVAVLGDHWRPRAAECAPRNGIPPPASIVLAECPVVASDARPKRATDCRCAAQRPRRAVRAAERAFGRQRPRLRDDREAREEVARLAHQPIDERAAHREADGVGRLGGRCVPPRVDLRDRRADEAHVLRVRAGVPNGRVVGIPAGPCRLTVGMHALGADGDGVVLVRVGRAHRTAGPRGRLPPAVQAQDDRSDMTGMTRMTMASRCGWTEHLEGPRLPADGDGVLRQLLRARRRADAHPAKQEHDGKGGRCFNHFGCRSEHQGSRSGQSNDWIVVNHSRFPNDGS